MDELEKYRQAMNEAYDRWRQLQGVVAYLQQKAAEKKEGE